MLLAILEAKLNSVPGLEYSTNDLPTASTTPANSTQSTSSVAAPPPTSTSAPPPPSSTAPAGQSNPPSSSVDIDVGSAPSSTGVAASDHPDYAMFFKLVRLGVPPHVVKAKVEAAGLDPTAIDNPSMIIASGGGGGGGGSTGSQAPLSRRIFDKFDSDRSGSIDSSELQKMAIEFGVWLDGNALQIAMRIMDRNGNGSISYDEFLNWYKSSSFQSLQLDDVTLQRRNAAAKVFAKYDDDKSGNIDRREFEGLFKEIKMLNLTTHSVDKAMEDMDSDGDGMIQFNEFVAWLDRH